MQEVLIGAALFTGVVLVLALLIMAARARLVPSGTVTINVNGERDLTVPVGGKLLNLLADEDILLPSACGGGATCGQCTITVLEGGGALLPTERSHISRLEAARGKRLACQVTVMDDMRVVVPGGCVRGAQMDLHRAFEPQRRDFYQRADTRIAGERDYRVSRGRLRANRVARVRAGLQQPGYSGRIPRRLGALQPVQPALGRDRTGNAGLFDGELPGGKSHHHAECAHRDPAADRRRLRRPA